jgi:uncharacterized membrane protein
VTDEDVECEERAIYVTAIAALAPIVILALVRHAAFDGGTTLCLVLTVCAIVLLAARLRKGLQLPPAHMRSRPS